MSRLRFQRTWYIIYLFIFSSWLGVFGADVKAAEAKKSFPNPTYEFTALDGSTVSTVDENGRITVIVFGKTSCGNSQATIKNIAMSGLAGRDDIRVIFGEVNGASREETSNFAKSYGNEDIIFCCDDVDFMRNTPEAKWGFQSISDVMWEYHDMFYEPAASGSLPFTVLIDADNQVRNVLKGNQTANGILAEIRKFSEEGSGDPILPADCLNIDIEGTENYDYANQVLQIVNQARRQKEIADLKMDEELQEAAMQRAAEIAMYYSHTRPDGSSCTTITKRGTKKAENIAAGQSMPQLVMNDWLSSEGHYANIMDPELTSIGIGCFADENGTLHWVQYFDNAQASPPSRLGSRHVTRTITIQKSKLHLYTAEQQKFSCSKANETVSVDIFNSNEEFQRSKARVCLSNFNVISSLDATAQVQADGSIIIKDPGKAVITATNKTDHTVSVQQEIIVDPHDYAETIVPPTAEEEGYTLHVCNKCHHSYKDSFVAKLPGTSGGNNNNAPGKETEQKVSNVSGVKAKTKADQAALTWKKVPEADGYIIYQYQSSKKQWKKIASFNTNKAAYTVKKLKAATGYRFAVKAFAKHDGKITESKSYASLYTATAPKEVKWKAVPGKKKASLHWNKVKGASGYTVYYKTSAKGSWKELKSVKGTKYTKTKLKTGKSYYFTVKAYKTYKGKTYFSSFQAKKVKVK